MGVKKTKEQLQTIVEKVSKEYEVTKLHISQIVFPVVDYRYKRTEKAYETVRERIRKFGIKGVATVVERDDGLYELVDGWYFVRACEELGYSEIPTIILKGDVEEIRMILATQDFIESKRNVMDLAANIIEWCDRHKVTYKAAAIRFNLSYSYVKEIISFFKNAPEDLKIDVATGNKSYSAAKSEWRWRKKKDRGDTWGDSSEGNWREEPFNCPHCNEQKVKGESIRICNECYRELLETYKELERVKSELNKLRKAIRKQGIALDSFTDDVISDDGDEDEFDVLDYHFSEEWKWDDAY